MQHGVLSIISQSMLTLHGHSITSLKVISRRLASDFIQSILTSDSDIVFKVLPLNVYTFRIALTEKTEVAH